MDATRALLLELGLNDKEADVYLALLPVGSAPASVLAARTNITRSTAQYTCQQLAKKGIVRMVQRTNTYIYVAEPPEKLMLLLERERSALEEKARKTERIIGELKDMVHPDVHIPRVRFFQGKDEMVALYKNILKIGGPIDSFEDKGEMAGFIPDYIPDFIAERKRRKIFNRVICPDLNTVNVRSETELREVRTLPVDRYPFSWDVKICGDLVSIFSFEKHTAVGIAIEHRDLADNFKLLFECLWDALGARPPAPARRVVA